MFLILEYVPNIRTSSPNTNNTTFLTKCHFIHPNPSGHRKITSMATGYNTTNVPLPNDPTSPTNGSISGAPIATAANTISTANRIPI